MDKPLPRCSLCLKRKEDGSQYMFYWNDCGPDGMDEDGTCCKACAVLSRKEQVDIRHKALTEAAEQRKANS